MLKEPLRVSTLPAVDWPQPGEALLSAPGEGWLSYRDPIEILVAHEPGEIRPLLKSVDEHTAAGHHAVGFLSYEAAPGLDQDFETAQAGAMLAWFGIYRDVHAAEPPRIDDTDTPSIQWEPDITDTAYREAVSRIRDYIATGDTYQVNFSYRMTAQLETGTPAFLSRFFQPGSYNAMIHTGEQIIVSGSPELFFSRQGRTITCRPMKGTAPRGLSFMEDHAQREWLRHSAKNRAENIMIVDMVRNDLGRICAPGSIHAEQLFDIETYPNVHQMTSTVSGRSDADLPTLLQALFPCASITGAPKVRTMQIIRELEHSPRGIYTGCIGRIEPGGDACFRIAIRTAVLDQATGRVTYGTGGGIVWDSDPEEELQETRVKSIQLTGQNPYFEILETLLHDGRTWFLLDRHLHRMERAAAYFLHPFDREAAKHMLEAAGEGMQGEKAWKVRLLLSPDGNLELQASFIEIAISPPTWCPPEEPSTCSMAIARVPIETNTPFVHFKTTRRGLYTQFVKMHPDADEVVLFNKQSQVTEGINSSIAVDLDGTLYTPPLTCGLLAGTLRAELIERGVLEERVITLAELEQAREVYFINSVRGWRRGVVGNA